MNTIRCLLVHGGRVVAHVVTIAAALLLIPTWTTLQAPGSMAYASSFGTPGNAGVNDDDPAGVGHSPPPPPGGGDQTCTAGEPQCGADTSPQPPLNEVLSPEPICGDHELWWDNACQSPTVVVDALGLGGADMGIDRFDVYGFAPATRDLVTQQVRDAFAATDLRLGAYIRVVFANGDEAWLDVQDTPMGPAIVRSSEIHVANDGVWSFVTTADYDPELAAPAIDGLPIGPTSMFLPQVEPHTWHMRGDGPSRSFDWGTEDPVFGIAISTGNSPACDQHATRLHRTTLSSCRADKLAEFNSNNNWGNAGAIAAGVAVASATVAVVAFVVLTAPAAVVATPLAIGAAATALAGGSAAGVGLTSTMMNNNLEAARTILEAEYQQCESQADDNSQNATASCRNAASAASDTSLARFEVVERPLIGTDGECPAGTEWRSAGALYRSCLRTTVIVHTGEGDKETTERVCHETQMPQGGCVREIQL